MNLPLSLYSLKSSVLNHVEVGVVLVGPWWSLLVLWVIIQGQIGFSKPCLWGFVENQLHNDANVTVVSSFLCSHKGHRVGLYELHCYFNALIFGLSFNPGELFGVELGCGIVGCLWLA